MTLLVLLSRAARAGIVAADLLSLPLLRCNAGLAENLRNQRARDVFVMRIRNAQLESTLHYIQMAASRVGADKAELPKSCYQFAPGSALRHG